MTLPNFLLVGAQKSGTTSLTHQLGSHPEVFMLPDEVHFFDRDSNFALGPEWYRQQFARAAHESAVGESTPEYLYDADAVTRMAQLLPDARLLVSLRHPVERAYSQYWHNRTRGREPLSFRDAIAAEPDRIAVSDRSTRLRYSYVDRSRYLTQLQRMTAHYSRDRLHVVLFEQFASQPSDVLQSVFRFLGVSDGVPISVTKAHNRFVTFRSQRLRGPIRRLPSPLRRPAARLNVRYVRYPPIDADVRAGLMAELEPEIRELATWLGEDLGAWT